MTSCIESVGPSGNPRSYRMTATPLAELFHYCARAVWLFVAAETGQEPPDPERTRRLACHSYEAELRREQQGGPDASPELPDCRSASGRLQL